MSHFAQIAVQFKDRQGLIDALVASGVPRDAIEVHDEAQPLIDYREHKTRYRFQDSQDERFADCDKAHVIVRRQHLGSANNDLGFYLAPDGESICFLCEYSRNSTQWNDSWLGKVRQHYSGEQIEAEHAEKSEEVVKVQHEGKIYLYVKQGG